MSEVDFVAPQASPESTPPPTPAASPPDEDLAEPPRSRWRRRGELGPRSLTARLSVGVVALVIVLVSAISAGTYFLLRSYLNDKLDEQTASATQQNAQYFQHCLDRLQPSSSGSNSASCFPGGGPPPLSQAEWLAFVTPDGKSPFYIQPSTTTKASYQRLILTTLQARAILASPTTSHHIVYAGHSMIVQAAETDQGIFVVTGLTTESVEDTMRTLVFREMLIGLAAVAIALVATSYGVSFGLRKLRRVTATAREVAVEMGPTGAALERRVDVPDDGTEVGQLAESMNTMLSAVDTQFKQRLESEARLRQFLADASHELRTPLTSIRGYAELARMQKAAGADAEDNLSRIESEGNRMSRLVEDLLMLARGEQPTETVPVRELVDVADLVEGAARDAKAAWPQRDVFAEATPGLQVLGDFDQLLRAVRNLAANAAVHTAPERPIVVRSAPDGDDVLIQVVDGGPGLAPEDAAKVFERFWRADKARTRARGGTGLGMSIVAAIVANHGGTVRFDSAVETGSTVTIRLPAVRY